MTRTRTLVLSSELCADRPGSVQATEPAHVAHPAAMNCRRLIPQQAQPLNGSFVCIVLCSHDAQRGQGGQPRESALTAVIMGRRKIQRQPGAVTMTK